MAKVSKILLIVFAVSLLIISGCAQAGLTKQEEYEKCTSVCASVLSDDFVTLELCRRECEKKFLT